MTKRKWGKVRPYKDLPHSHRLVRRMFDLMRETETTQTDIAEEAGVSINWFSHIRVRSMPRVDTLDAVLNVMGYRLDVVRIEDASEVELLSASQREIIHALRRDHHYSWEEFARETGMTEGTLRTYIKLIEKRGVYEAILNANICYNDEGVWLEDSKKHRQPGDAGRGAKK